MKKILSVFFALIMVASMIIQASALTPFVIERNSSSFLITDGGLAIMSYHLRGDANTESITVTIKLEKRTLLLFWTDVEEWTVTSYSAEFSGEKTYQLTDSGTYRCTIVYEETSSDGTVDTYEYQEKAEYDPA